jgi:predicted nicotinamide N-methyase
MLNNHNGRGNEQHLQIFERMYFDYILCSDLVYDPDSFDSLITTLNRLCHKSTKIFMCYKYRYPRENRFFEQLMIHFHVNKVGSLLLLFQLLPYIV